MWLTEYGQLFTQQCESYQLPRYMYPLNLGILLEFNGKTWEYSLFRPVCWGTVQDQSFTNIHSLSHIWVLPEPTELKCNMPFSQPKHSMYCLYETHGPFHHHSTTPQKGASMLFLYVQWLYYWVYKCHCQGVTLHNTPSQYCIMHAQYCLYKM